MRPLDEMSRKQMFGVGGGEVTSNVYIRRQHPTGTRKFYPGTVILNC